MRRYAVDIYLGLGVKDGLLNTDHVKRVIKKFCDDEKIGLSYHANFFIYPNGEEPGLVLHLINYPRFPDTNENILKKAVKLAEMLKKECEQERVIIETPDEVKVI